MSIDKCLACSPHPGITVLCRLLDPIWHFRPDIHHRLQQVVTDLVASVASNLLDLLYLLLALVVRILFRLLVAA